MTVRPWSKFFWSDWEADQGLRLCSLAAQGLWMRMLCVCANNDPKGYLAINGKPLDVTDIARLAGVTGTEAATLMDELDLNGVFSRNRTGCIYSRRMVQDEKLSQEGRKHKKCGIEQTAENKGEKPIPSRGPPRGASPHIPEARSQKKNSDTFVSDGEAVADDFLKQVFDTAIGYLGQHGTRPQQARSFVGKLRKSHADADILAAFAACGKAGAVDPIPWIVARLARPKTDLDAAFAQFAVPQVPQ